MYSWAQDELGVALDVVDNLITSQRLNISSISKHNSGLASKNPNALIKSGTRQNCTFAKSLFQNAALKVNERFKANTSAREIPFLVELSNLGWPLFRIGQRWFVNYGYEALLNLPYNTESIVGIKFVNDEPSLTFPKSPHLKLKITLDEDKCFCFVDQVKLSNNELHNTLQRARLQTLDTAILGLMESVYAENLIVDQNLKSVLEIHLSNHSYRFELINGADVVMADHHATIMGTKLYQSFIESRSSSVNLSIIL